MKKFEFRLERLKKLREIQEQEQKRKLGFEVSKMNAINEEFQSAVALKDQVSERCAGLERQGQLDLLTMRRWHSYENMVEWSVREKQIDLDAQDEKVNEAREYLRIARCRTQILEKMRERTHHTWLKDLQREEMKEMGEIAIQRYHRRSREEGSVGNALLVFFASISFFTIIFLGILLAFGQLTPHKMLVMWDLLKFHEPVEVTPEALEEHQTAGGNVSTPKANHHLVVGPDPRPYLMHDSEIRRLYDMEYRYNKLLKKIPVDDKSLTKEVEEERRKILHRVLGLIQLEKEKLEKAQGGIDSQKQKLKSDIMALEKKMAEFEKTKQQYSSEKYAKGQEMNLQYQNISDPAIVASHLTNDMQFEDYNVRTTQGRLDRQNAIRDISNYLKNMEPRKRAAVQEALGPKWSYAINKYIEQYPEKEGSE